jgi:cytochrome c oxidase subunit 2
MFWIAAAVCVGVTALLIYAALHRRDEVRRATPSRDARSLRWIMLGGVAFPVVTLTVVLVETLRTHDAIVRPRNGDLVVEVAAKQYWWEVRYRSPGAPDIVTANEIHVPVGRRVELHLTSPDVIHSFWAPELHGKLDHIPGRVNVLHIQADTPGVYPGYCAEYCGRQHAKMRFVVVAEPPDSFRAWLANEAAPARPPADSSAARGREVYLAAGCGHCHAVRGVTDPAPRHGPDLTHMASRRTLAAGIMAMNRGNLGGWIANPQALKRGNRMPAIPIPSEELHPLLDYLMSLR